MKIVVINPNSSEEMTKDIRRTAEEFVGDRFEVITVLTPGAPEFIDGYADDAAALPGMIEIVKKMESDADAFIIACHGDPGIDVLKEISHKPVVGIGEASMKIATMLGHKFSVLTTSRKSIAGKEAEVEQYRLMSSLASVRVPDEEKEYETETDAYYEAGVLARDIDNAEVMVLGCAGLTGLDEVLTKRLNVPVLDGIKCALVIAEGIIRMGQDLSRLGRYQWR